MAPVDVYLRATSPTRCAREDRENTRSFKEGVEKGLVHIIFVHIKFACVCGSVSEKECMLLHAGSMYMLIVCL